MPARDREGLERLARYVLRPPVEKDQLERRGDRVARRRARKLTRSPASGGDGRDTWAEVLRRVFGKDGFARARCGKAMTLRAIVVGETATGTILRSLARGPPRHA